MSINFILNDPAVPGQLPQVVDASVDPDADRVGFTVTSLPPEQVYSPGTTEFVAWQAREAALRAVGVFEDIAGPLVGWQGEAKRKRLRLDPDMGLDLNAYYDRQSLGFYHYQTGRKTIFSGASTDVVAHEAGHAILDALRPALWGTPMFEVDAFHEGFGDCVAVMLALSDQASRTAILQGDPRLDQGNFVEATAEELAAGVKVALGPNHNAGAPRRALNSFKWSLSGGLPEDGKPGVLIEEIHSFGQLTSGCYYDLIRGIFRAGAGGEEELWSACRTATDLLAKAVRTAPIRPGFLESVGRTMILVDRRAGILPDGSGRHEAHIRSAFEGHGLPLSVSSFLAPRALLAKGRKRKARMPTGKAVALTTRSATALLAAPAQVDLRTMLGVDAGTRLEARGFELAGTQVAQVAVRRAIDLTGLAEGLSDVKAYTLQETFVGPTDGGQALLGAVDPSAVISGEVRNYVGVLVRRNLITFDDTKEDGGGAAADGKRNRRSDLTGWLWTGLIERISQDCRSWT